MNVVSILRQLWDRRLLVTVGVAVAFVVADLVAFKFEPGFPPKFESRQYPVGIASAEVLVDSPNSQVIDLGNSETKADVTSLNGRARLLADLMATSPLKDQIARRAGIAPDQLIAIRPSVAPTAAKPTPLETGANVSTSDPKANILSLRVQETLPIIGADAQAPEPATAAKISDAAIAELGIYLRDAASAGAVPAGRKLLLEPLGPARSSLVTRGPRRLTAVVIAVVLLLLWCAAIVITGALSRSWREANDEARLSSATGGIVPSPVSALPLDDKRRGTPKTGETAERPKKARKPAARKESGAAPRTSSKAAAPKERKPAARKERKPAAASSERAPVRAADPASRAERVPDRSRRGTVA